MPVYYNKNGNPFGRSKNSEKLTAYPVGRTFLWENQEVLIPAVYTGKSGAILDICIKIPLEDMILFLKKWNKDRRLSLHTQEEYEQMETDNPCCIDFEADMYFDDIPLKQRMRSSLMWYPKEVFYLEDDDALSPAAQSADLQEEDEVEIPAVDACSNDRDAEKLMKTYDLDRSFCWYFGRLVYCWQTKALLSPGKIALTLKAEPKSITVSHFTTDLSCLEQIIKITHPTTGQKYLLTLHECKETKLPLSDFGKKNMLYPRYCHELFYSVSPRPECNLLDIRDCDDGDSPRRADASDNILSESCGPTAIFAAGRSGCLDKSIAFSSLRFQPVPKICWRVVFWIKPKEDAEISFAIG